MTTLPLLAATLLAGAASPALAGRCEPPPQHTADDSAARAAKPNFGCPANPQLFPAAVHHRMNP